MANMLTRGTESCWVAEVDDETFDLVRDDNNERIRISHKDVIVAVPITNWNDPHAEYQLLAVSIREAVGRRRGAEVPGRHFSLINCHAYNLSEEFVERHSIPHLPIHLALCRAPFAPIELSVIVSTKSGVCEASAFYNSVVKPFLETLGLSERHYSVHHTESEQSITDFTTGTLVPRANAGISQMVLLLSGDGGMIDIINGLFSSKPSSSFVKPIVSLLILGTGNAMANSSGLNNDATRGLRSFLRGKPRRVPTFATRFSPGSVVLVDEGRKAEPLPPTSSIDSAGLLHGAVVTSWCLHASLVADSDTTEYRKHGPQRFSMAANELLKPSDGSPPHVYRGHVTTLFKDQTGALQSKLWDRREHMYMLVTLVSRLEAALTISPDSRPLDGQLRMVDFGPLPIAEVKRVFGQAYASGQHVSNPVVGYEAVEFLHIDFQEPDPRWRRVCVDGKIVLVGEGGWVEVKREERDVVDLVIEDAS